MRRYAVRFLVALLTFALGIVLSLAFGLFKPHGIFVSDTTWSKRPPCPKQFRVARPEFVTTDTQLGDPLRLKYLGDTPDGRMRFMIENTRDQMVSAYAIRGDRIWGSDGQPGTTVFEWHSSDLLGPGETRLVTTVPRNTDGLSLHVASVTFESGFTWINPRDRN